MDARADEQNGTEAEGALNVATNRDAVKYTPREQVMRVLWGAARPLFRFSPRICFGWRRFLLRRFGAKVGREVHIYNSAVVYMPWNLEIGDWSAVGELAYIYNLGPVRIGSRVTVSHMAHLCAGTHDHTRPDMPLIKPPIEIGDQAWICAQAFVGPGVKIGEGAVVAAAAAVVRDVEPWSIVGGNPAKIIGGRKIGE